MSEPTPPGPPAAAPDPEQAGAPADRAPGGDAASPNTPWSAPPTGGQPTAPYWGWPPYGTYGAQPAAPAPTRRRRASLIALCLAFLVVGVFLGVGFSHGFWTSHGTVQIVPGGFGSNSLPSGNGGSNGLPSGNGGSNGFPFGNVGGGSVSGGSTSSAPGAPSNVRAIASKVDPAVVDIDVSYGALAPGTGGAGTGIVLSPTGLVLTNNHVIDQAATIKATDLGNGRTYTATVLGYDATSDVALLQLQGASGLKTATLGDSARVKDGEPVVGIGNAGGSAARPARPAARYGPRSSDHGAEPAGASRALERPHRDQRRDPARRLRRTSGRRRRSE